jgi:hypothetical protein
MLEIFCKARLRLALQKISTCSLTHDVSSLEDDNIKYTCIFRGLSCLFVFKFKNFVNTRHCSISTIYQGFVELYTIQILEYKYIVRKYKKIKMYLLHIIDITV